MSLGKAAYRIGVAADDRQVLVARRFNFTWSPSSVEAGGDTALTTFQVAFSSLLSYLRAEQQSDAGEPIDRTRALLAFAAIMNVDGSSVAYSDRNTRYTNMAGTFMAEPIEPSLPMDATGPLGSIPPNPLNYPELQDKPNL